MINCGAYVKSLAFVLEIADYIEETMSVHFRECLKKTNWAGLAGVYPTNSC